MNTLKRTLSKSQEEGTDEETLCLNAPMTDESDVQQEN